MLAELRRSRIITTIRQKVNGFASVQELSHALGVSGMTIRRDLEYLEGQSAICRVHGGAVISSGDAKSQFFRQYSITQNGGDLLGRLAAGLVYSGERIILDGGPLMQSIAVHLSDFDRLTVITNNLLVSEQLSRFPEMNIILLGGYVALDRMVTTGGMVQRDLEPLSADKVFLSPAGFSLQNGIGGASQEEADVCQAMLQSAKEVILVAERSQYNRPSSYPVSPLERVHKLVTDDRFPLEEIEEVELRGVKVITPSRQQPRPEFWIEGRS